MEAKGHHPFLSRCVRMPASSDRFGPAQIGFGAKVMATPSAGDRRRASQGRTFPTFCPQNLQLKPRLASAGCLPFLCRSLVSWGFPFPGSLHCSQCSHCFLPKLLIRDCLPSCGFHIWSFRLSSFRLYHSHAVCSESGNHNWK